jgi:hypothetical protein
MNKKINHITKEIRNDGIVNEVISPTPNALNAYQLKGITPSKKREERINHLKPENGTSNA